MALREGALEQPAAAPAELRLRWAPDPDARVRGAGVARLRAAGVTVDEGVLQHEADALNAAYLVHRTEGRPWVRYKTPMTLDGKIATRTGRSRWITGAGARALAGERAPAGAHHRAGGAGDMVHRVAEPGPGGSRGPPVAPEL